MLAILAIDPGIIGAFVVLDAAGVGLVGDLPTHQGAVRSPRENAYR